MKTQWKIYEVDNEHLKKQVQTVGTKDRICFIEPELAGWYGNTHDTFDEAVAALSKYGNDYTEYTIVPRIYMTDF